MELAPAQHCLFLFLSPNHYAQNVRLEFGRFSLKQIALKYNNEDNIRKITKTIDIIPTKLQTAPQRPEVSDIVHFLREFGLRFHKRQTALLTLHLRSRAG